MGLNIWIIFAAVLLVSARARRYDQGPHTSYDFSTGLATVGPYGQRELILYLTPEQVRSLEADGAVVKSDEDDGTDSEISKEQPANEEQDDENDDTQDDENDNSQEEDDDSQEDEEKYDSQEEDAQLEEEIPEEKKNQNIDFESILRLLNEEQVDEETAKGQPINNPQIGAKFSEESRNFSPRFTFSRQQHEQKNIRLAAAKQEQIFKTYSNIRNQPYWQRQRFNNPFRQHNFETKTSEEFDEKLIGTPLQGTKKYKLIPYKIEEPLEEPVLAESDQQENTEAGEEQTAISKKLLRAELLKYAIRAHKLKNAENIRAQTYSKATALPINIKQQQSKRQSKTEKARNANTKQTKAQQLKSIAVPVMVAEKSRVQKPIKVPVETGKVVSNKPYIATRKVIANKKTNPRRNSK